MTPGTLGTQSKLAVTIIAEVTRRVRVRTPFPFHHRALPPLTLESWRIRGALPCTAGTGKGRPTCSHPPAPPPSRWLLGSLLFCPRIPGKAWETQTPLRLSPVSLRSSALHGVAHAWPPPAPSRVLERATHPAGPLPAPQQGYFLPVRDQESPWASRACFGEPPPPEAKDTGALQCVSARGCIPRREAILAESESIRRVCFWGSDFCPATTSRAEGGPGDSRPLQPGRGGPWGSLSQQGP